MHPRRLAIDIGTHSIGWALVDLAPDESPQAFVDAGVRVFGDSRDPQTSDPLGRARSDARQMRRQRDRRLSRQRAWLEALVDLGLLPEDPKARRGLSALDPYALRRCALEEALPPEALGRALLHLAKRRGFKSNRLAGGDEKEEGAVKEGIAHTRGEIDAAGATTLGAFLVGLDGSEAHRRPPRRRRYVHRDMIEAEFEAVVAAQERLGALGRETAEQLRARFRRIVVCQRPLKAQNIGTCSIDGESPRAPHALPVAQAVRIAQELVNLSLTEKGSLEPRRLTRNERDRAFDELRRGRDLTFERLAQKLGLSTETRFNLATASRKGLTGDRTARILAHKARFGQTWHKLSLAERDRIVERLLAIEHEAEAVDFARSLGLDAERAAKVAATRLPQGHGHVGRRVLNAILPFLRDGLTFHEAVERAGFVREHGPTGHGLDTLPDYADVLARFLQPMKSPTADDPDRIILRIANPTVHVGLNQLRKVVNALVERYGKPNEIHVELARDLKLSAAKNADIEREQARNRRLNEEADEAIRGTGQAIDSLGKGQLGDYRRRYRLWLELDDVRSRLCPYSGKPIAIGQLFSNAVEIEHILPYARTLDDSMANKTVAFAQANRDKANETPHEAFGEKRRAGYDWDAIAERAARLPPNKAWRFAANAMERFEGERAFADRQLNDTTYLARTTRLYLQCLYGRDDGHRVVAIPGKLTALLRHHWGLDTTLGDHNRPRPGKDRTDHRHHAIDAAVVACTDGVLLKRISDANKAERLDRIHVPEPFEGFREQLKERLERLVPSHRPDHGLGGRFVKEGAFGATGERSPAGAPLYRYRVALGALKPNHLSQPGGRGAWVRNDTLREDIRAFVEARMADGASFPAALHAYGEATGVRRVRLVEAKNVIPITDADGRPFKHVEPDANAWMDIIRLEDGRWLGWTVSRLDAIRARDKGDDLPAWARAHRHARRVMRLHRGDLVAISPGDGRDGIYRVVSIWEQGTVVLAGATQTGNLQKRHKDPGDVFQYLMPSASTLPKLRLRKVSVDPMGRVRDPGFPW